MKRPSALARFLRSLEWVGRQKRPFDYTDFEVENGVGHRAAQHFLLEAEKLGLVERTHGVGGPVRRRRTSFRALYRIQYEKIK